MWEVVLLIDLKENLNSKIISQEELLTKLKRRKVNCEYQDLPCFDYLWVARHPNEQNHNKWFVLPLGIERKTTTDFDRSLKKKNKETGLFRMDEQELKMDNSGVKHKVILLQGNLEAKIQKARTKAKLAEFERKGFDVYIHKDNRSMDSVIDLLVARHEEVEKDTMQSPPPCNYITYQELKERANFVVMLAKEQKNGTITFAEMKDILAKKHTMTGKTLEKGLENDKGQSQLDKNLFESRKDKAISKYPVMEPGKNFFIIDE